MHPLLGWSRFSQISEKADPSFAPQQVLSHPLG